MLSPTEQNLPRLTASAGGHVTLRRIGNRPEGLAFVSVAHNLLRGTGDPLRETNDGLGPATRTNREGREAQSAYGIRPAHDDARGDSGKKEQDAEMKASENSAKTPEDASAANSSSRRQQGVQNRQKGGAP